MILLAVIGGLVVGTLIILGLYRFVTTVSFGDEPKREVSELETILRKDKDGDKT